MVGAAGDIVQRRIKQHEKTSSIDIAEPVPCAELLPTAAFAQGKSYVALGDSITTGYGLTVRRMTALLRW